MRTLIFLASVLITSLLNAQLPAFNAKDQPGAPDYSKAENWAALPFRQDAADVVPKGEIWISDSLKEVDVFFIYPTIYRNGKCWDADVNDKALNKKIDNKPIHYQASVFNASARVYAPRYRQACIESFYSKDNGPQALEFAYQDVKRAFEYYLKNYNHGRPIIIASHSQGTRHARQLLKDFFDSTALRRRLVAAYIVGFGINKADYKNLKPCSNATETGCYVTWASFKNGYEPGKSALYDNVCVNPISWNMDTIAIDASKSMGSMLLSFNKVYEHASGAQIHNGFLWVKTSMPVIKGWNNMHIGDYNLFWYDIRKNVKDRVNAYLKK